MCIRDRLKAVADLRALPPATILVVPYLKASEIPSLRQLGVTGLIAETGGQLSHGAVVAREYGLPTVILSAGRDRLKARQTIRLDGSMGTLEWL